MVYTDGKHLMAKDIKELHSFALSVGLKREWFQDNLYHPHYDITTRRMLKRILDTSNVMLVSSRELIKWLT